MRRLLSHVDRVAAILNNPDYTFLASIELDVTAGRFPDVVQQYFCDDDTTDDDHVFVDAVRGFNSCGRLTFEMRVGQLARVLRYGDGWRWGPWLRVWGFQVKRELAGSLIELSPFDGRPETLATLRAASRACWITSPDLDLLVLWVDASVPSMSLKALTALATR